MSARARKDPPAPELGAAPAGGAPLRECVRQSLDHYFAQLDGHDPGDLFRLVMREVEAPLLEAVLSYTRGNQSRASQVLGINRGTLRKKLRLYGLE